MRASNQRVLSTVVLLAWMAPAAGALGLGLHVALDHHGDRGGRHASEISDLLRAAVHGHHHDVEAVPLHEHDVRIDSPEPAVRSAPPLVAVLPPSASSPSDRSERSIANGSPRRAPPGLLFASNCSLLL